MTNFLAENNENDDCLGSVTVRKHFVSCSNYLRFFKIKWCLYILKNMQMI